MTKKFLLIVSILLLTFCVSVIAVYAQDANADQKASTNAQTVKYDDTQMILYYTNPVSTLDRTPEKDRKSITVAEFVKMVRSGDKKIFRSITYDVLERVTREINYKLLPNQTFEEALTESQIGSFVTDSYNKAVRNRVIQSTLSGLYNADPQVRLVAINWLRRLKPEASMQRDVKTALALETVCSPREKWRMKNFDAPGVKYPWLEARKWGEQLTYVKVGQGVQDVDNRWNNNNADNGGNVTFPSQNYQFYYEGEKKYADYQNAENDYWTDYIKLKNGIYNGKPVSAEREKVPTGEGERYWYIDTRATLHHDNVWAELNKLDLFITRVIWYNKVDRLQLNTLVLVSKDTFYPLYASIDGESHDKVPMKSLRLINAKHVDVLIEGLLNNKVISTKWVIAVTLKEIYKKSDTSKDVRKKIRAALKKARYEEQTLDYMVGLDYHLELRPTNCRYTIIICDEDVARTDITCQFFDTEVDRYDVNRPDYLKLHDLATKYYLSSEFPHNLSLALDATQINQIDAFLNKYYSTIYSGGSVGGGSINSLVTYLSQRDFNLRGLNIEDATTNLQVIRNVYNVIDVEKEKYAFIKAMKSGDKDYFKSITYDRLKIGFVKLVQESVFGYANATLGVNVPGVINKPEFVNSGYKYEDREFYNDDFFIRVAGSCDAFRSLRPNFINTLLSGLTNTDPRVRLTVIHLLRRISNYEELAPDTTLVRDEVEKVYQQEIETVSIDAIREYYEYLDVDGRYQVKVVWEELDLLRKFLIRADLVGQIRKGSDVLTTVPKFQFETLYKRLDNEPREFIPLLYTDILDTNATVKVKAIKHKWRSDLKVAPLFLQKDIEAISKGLENKNFYVQRGTADYLINLYDDNMNYSVNPAVSLLEKKNQDYIKTVIRNAEEDDVVAQQVVIYVTGEPLNGRRLILAKSPFAWFYNREGVTEFLKKAPMNIKDPEDTETNMEEDIFTTQP